MVWVRGVTGEDVEVMARWRAVESWHEFRGAVRVSITASLMLDTARRRFILSQLVVLGLLGQRIRDLRLTKISAGIGSGVVCFGSESALRATDNLESI